MTSVRERHVSWRRLLAGGLAITLLVALAGFALELWRYGASEASAAARVEAHVRRDFDRMTAVLSRIGRDVAADPSTPAGLVAAADGARLLFDVLDRHVGDAASTDQLAVTIYNAEGDARAWAGRPSDIRVGEVPTFFVTQSPLGLRLMHVVPIAGADSRRLGLVAAEHVLSPAHAPTLTDADWFVPTPFGPAALRMRWEVVGDRPAPGAFVLPDPSGAPLVEASISPAATRGARNSWRRRVFAAVLTSFAVTVLLLIGPVLDRRTRATPARVRTMTWGAGVLLAIGVAGVYAAMAVVAWRRPALAMLVLLGGAAATSMAALLAAPVAQLRVCVRRRRLTASSAPVRFVGAHLAAGAALALIVVAFERVLGGVVDPATFDLRHFSLYPWNVTRLVLLVGVLACHIAALWLGVLVLTTALAYWRPSGRRLRDSAILAALWLLPAAAVAVAATMREWPIPPWGLLASCAACVAAALIGRRVLTWYRHAAVAARILTLFLAFLVPALLLYPSIEFFGGRGLRRLIAERYALEALNHPQQLQDRLAESLEQIDDIAALPALVSGSAEPTGEPRTEEAFLVWKRTSLAAARLTASIELYNRDNKFISRWGLKLPEYTGTAQAPEAVSGCRWDVFGEAAPFGSDERRMLHAERKICVPGPDGSQQPVGSIVVHVAFDYRTLPFITSQSPYIELFRAEDTTAPREGSTAANVETVIYGWGLGPIYRSGATAWPISESLFARIYKSREPFWAEVEQADGKYRVYFANDRVGIFALGYRAPTLFDDLVHLSELTTLAGTIYLLVLLGTGVFTRLARERPKVGRALLREIRASFYRKLFLAFVLASIIPVLTLAFVIREYFANQLREDVQEEAGRTAAVAQRVIEEAETLQRRSAEPLGSPSDDMLVWISQLIDQDVNIFEGPRLMATSERDLFASGLLPERTPEDVYRAIVLQRLPGFVSEDRVGTFPYMIASAPVRWGERETVVTVPLANRQREIEREIDEVDRGVHLAALFFVLVGAGIGLSMAERIADPVRRLTRATRQIARGDFDARIAVRSVDELRRLVDAFNSMADELKTQRAQLERTHRLEAWAEMARQVAHEIKNPLTPIQLSAEHLRRVHADRGEPMGEVLEGCVNSILGQVRLLRQISAEFSSFASAPTARPAPVDLVSLVAEVVDPYRTGLAHRIEIENRVTPPLPQVFVDRTLIARALVNVVENALHAMPGRGSLTLDGAAADGFVTVEIRDTGVGMDADALARVFEPYFSTKTTGTGLGLPIALRNVELNGGTLEVTSEKGAGTTVRMRLPIAGRAA